MTNSTGLKLVEILKALILEPKITNIDIATGYWDIKGLYLIKQDIYEIDNKSEYFSSIELLFDFCKKEVNSPIEIRCFKDEKEPSQFFHSKCYVFYGQSVAYGIIGSSNFTSKGLEGNCELNYFETNPMIVTYQNQEGFLQKGHRAWFEEKWNLA